MPDTAQDPVALIREALDRCEEYVPSRSVNKSARAALVVLAERAERAEKRVESLEWAFDKRCEFQAAAEARVVELEAALRAIADRDADLLGSSVARLIVLHARTALAAGSTERPQEGREP